MKARMILSDVPLLVAALTLLFNLSATQRTLAQDRKVVEPSYDVRGSAQESYDSAIAVAKRGDFDAALRALRHALSQDRFYSPAASALSVVTQTIAGTIKRDAALAFFTGVSSGNEQQWDRAIKELTTAIDIDPRFSSAYDERGGCFFGKGAYDQAIADYNKAIQLNSRNAATYVNRGRAYYGQGRADKAVADFSTAITLDPNFDRAFYNRGVLFVVQREYTKAIADLDKAIVLNPNLAEAIHNRGAAYDSLGNKEAARRDFKKACSMGMSLSCQALQ